MLRRLSKIMAIKHLDKSDAMNERPLKVALAICIGAAVAHFAFMINFLICGVTELVVYNIFSVAYFVTLFVVIKYSKQRNLIVVESMFTIEVILHQVLAVYFVGWEFGYQYILFFLAVPCITFFNNDRFKKLDYIRCMLAISVYLLLWFFTFKGIMQPVYSFDNETYKFLFNCTIIIGTFLILCYMVHFCYHIFEHHILQSRQKELEEKNRLISVQENIISSIASIIESRDSSTGEHTVRTSKFVETIVNELRNKGKYDEIISDVYVSNVVSAAVLHDIGKIKTPDMILNKPDRLTEEEFEIIKEHSANGSEIIEKILANVDDDEYMTVAYNIALYHHERFDGTGYPKGLKGKDIPLEARIMSVADVYDALLSERCYKASMEKDEATKLIYEGKGTQFDPDIIDVFMDLRQRELI